MKPPTICGNSVSENLHALAADLVNPRGRAMDRWDQIRGQVETHKGSDLPRMNFEGLLEDFSDAFTDGAKEIERLTAENERLRAALKTIEVECSCMWCAQIADDALNQQQAVDSEGEK